MKKKKQQQPSLFEEMVMEVAKLTRDTVVACGPRESALLADPSQQSLYHAAIKSLFAAFARCLQQLAFSGTEDSAEDEFATVSPLTGAHSAFRIRDSKLHGPVSLVLTLFMEDRLVVDNLESCTFLLTERYKTRFGFL